MSEFNFPLDLVTTEVFVKLTEMVKSVLLKITLLVFFIDHTLSLIWPLS